LRRTETAGLKRFNCAVWAVNNRNVSICHVKPISVCSTAATNRTLEAFPNTSTALACFAACLFVCGVGNQATRRTIGASVIVRMTLPLSHGVSTSSGANVEKPNEHWSNVLPRSPPPLHQPCGGQHVLACVSGRSTSNFQSSLSSFRPERSRLSCRPNTIVLGSWLKKRTYIVAVKQLFLANAPGCDLLVEVSKSVFRCLNTAAYPSNGA